MKSMIHSTGSRRAFFGKLGLFSILPGAGRVWKAVSVPPGTPRLASFWYQESLHFGYISKEYLDCVNAMLRDVDTAFFTRGFDAEFHRRAAVRRTPPSQKTV